MSSQINQTSIDNAYPVAGKDNDSQGFRDNFAAIKTNFTSAKAEIEDLQSKVLLKSALTGETLNNNLGGSNLSNGTHTNFHGTSYGPVSVSSSANINIENGPLQTFLLTADTDFTFTNWPDSGTYGLVRVHFKNNGSVMAVGNDITIGNRYTINEVNTTNFITMGADPTAVFSGTITGSTLTVISKTSGTITKDMYIIGAGVAAGTKIIATNIENPSLTGSGSSGTYTVDIGSQSVTGAMSGITTGVVFIATNKGSGTGNVKPWKEVSLSTESGGTVINDSNFRLPLLLNPNGADQAIEAWTLTGSTDKRVFVSYVGNLDTTNTSYLNLNIGSLQIAEETESTSTNTGSLQLLGGAGIKRNLNVGGNTVIAGNLLVSGTTTLTTSSVTIADIGSIGNVAINTPISGDSLKYNASLSKWTNNVDLVQYAVTINDNGSGTQPVFFINSAALSTSTGVQASGLTNFRVGKKYRFNQVDSSNFGYDLRFSTTPDTVVNPDNNPGTRTVTDYSSNVNVVGNAGAANSYTEILITQDTPSPLYLYGKQSDRALEPAFSISSLVITGTQGQISVGSCTLTTNQPIRISGVFVASSGTPSIFGYNSAGTIYYVKLGGTGTTFQLLSTPNGQPIGTTAGTPNGTLITVAALQSVVSYVETSKVGAEFPITVDGGPVKIIKNYTVSGSQNILADTTFGAITVTLPALPTVGTTVSIFDSGNAGTNAITINPGDALINNESGNIAISGDYGSLTLVYDGANWTLARLSFNGSEDVANNGTVSLNTSVSYFSTSGAENCTLAAGVEGQIKTLVMKNASGSMQVAVADAGWKTSGSGTVTFNTTGDTCVLQYIQDKWYVVGNSSASVEGITAGEIVAAPATASSAGVAGQIAYDSTYIYICTAANTWKRAAIASW